MGFGRPAVESSIVDPIGRHVPLTMREKIWTGSYIEIALLSKQARDLLTDYHVTSELVITNGQIIAEKRHLKTINNINNWTTAFIINMSIYIYKYFQEKPRKC